MADFVENMAGNACEHRGQGGPAASKRLFNLFIIIARRRQVRKRRSGFP
jgi:hypothetical protein